MAVRDQDPDTVPDGQSMNTECSEDRRICGYRLYAGVRNEQRMALRLGFVHENGRLLILDRLRGDVQAVQVGNE
jgi:hypothetical protein